MIVIKGCILKVNCVDLDSRSLAFHRDLLVQDFNFFVFFVVEILTQLFRNYFALFKVLLISFESVFDEPIAFAIPGGHSNIFCL